MMTGILLNNPWQAEDRNKLLKLQVEAKGFSYQSCQYTKEPGGIICIFTFGKSGECLYSDLIGVAGSL